MSAASDGECSQLPAAVRSSTGAKKTPQLGSNGTPARKHAMVLGAGGVDSELPVAAWDVDRVCVWAGENNMPEFAAVARDEEIDGAVLLSIDDSDLHGLHACMHTRAQPHAPSPSPTHNICACDVAYLQGDPLATALTAAGLCKFGQRRRLELALGKLRQTAERDAMVSGPCATKQDLLDHDFSHGWGTTDPLAMGGWRAHGDLSLKAPRPATASGRQTPNGRQTPTVCLTPSHSMRSMGDLHDAGGKGDYLHDAVGAERAPQEPMPSAVLRLGLSLVFCGGVIFTSAGVMTFVHDRVPDMEKYPPLPDLVLDHIPMIPWAFEASEVFISVLRVCMNVRVCVCVCVCARARVSYGCMMRTRAHTRTCRCASSCYPFFSAPPLSCIVTACKSCAASSPLSAPSSCSGPARCSCLHLCWRCLPSRTVLTITTMS